MSSSKTVPKPQSAKKRRASSMPPPAPTPEEETRRKAARASLMNLTPSISNQNDHSIAASKTPPSGTLTKDLQPSSAGPSKKAISKDRSTSKLARTPENQEIKTAKTNKRKRKSEVDDQATPSTAVKKTYQHPPGWYGTPEEWKRSSQKSTEKAKSSSAPQKAPTPPSASEDAQTPSAELALRPEPSPQVNGGSQGSPAPAYGQDQAARAADVSEKAEARTPRKRRSDAGVKRGPRVRPTDADPAVVSSSDVIATPNESTSEETPPVPQSTTVPDPVRASPSSTQAMETVSLSQRRSSDKHDNTDEQAAPSFARRKGPLSKTLKEQIVRSAEDTMSFVAQHRAWLEEEAKKMEACTQRFSVSSSQLQQHALQVATSQGPLMSPPAESNAERISSLQSKVDELTKENGVLNKPLKQSKKASTGSENSTKVEIAALNGTIEGLRGEITKLEDAKNDARTENSLLEAKLNRVQTEKAELSDHLDKELKKSQKLRQQAQPDIQGVKERISDLYQKLSTDVDEKTASKVSMKSQLDSVEEHLDALLKEVDTFRKWEPETTKAKERVQKKLQKLAKANKALEEENAKLKLDASEVVKSTPLSDGSASSDIVRELEDANKALISENAKLKKMLAKTDTQTPDTLPVAPQHIYVVQSTLANPDRLLDHNVLGAYASLAEANEFARTRYNASPHCAEGGEIEEQEMLYQTNGSRESAKLGEPDEEGMVFEVWVDEMKVKGTAAVSVQKSVKEGIPKAGEYVYLLLREAPEDDETQDREVLATFANLDDANQEARRKYNIDAETTHMVSKKAWEKISGCTYVPSKEEEERKRNERAMSGSDLYGGYDEAIVSRRKDGGLCFGERDEEGGGAVIWVERSKMQ
ncbi:hypothetical protein LTS18_006575 [Coniosporium uncinatum]|uniref:Uncharacterized protein n=1 Tax=Coniosporium uncinatum TaxID=93489 RepID=A0ACC3DX91_9PEZI|nr:hypothetical protein LTS18_006575 [Coniosporium uncinatum]